MIFSCQVLSFTFEILSSHLFIPTINFKNLSLSHFSFTFDSLPFLFFSLLLKAYAEALYHAEKGVWDYRRITQQWWDNLLLDVSISKNIDILMERHPMPLFADNIPFSRPLIPYVCPKGGCGKGTCIMLSSSSSS